MTAKTQGSLLMEDTSDQTRALDAFARWKREGTSQVFKLHGYAGTGKTTLARRLADGENGVFVAPTGKAAKVLESKGCAGAKTIHSLVYRPLVKTEKKPRVDLNGKPVTDKEGKPVMEERKKLLGFERKERVEDVGLIIVDESSMVGARVTEDLLSFGIPILALGDPGQLPPVMDGKSVFTAGKPDAMLTEITRQAKGSPIIRISAMVRNGRLPPVGRYAKEVQVVHKNKMCKNLLNRADKILVGKNITRHNFTAGIRKMRGFHGDFPEPGEVLICLKNGEDVRNGELFIVESVKMFNADNRWMKIRLKDAETGSAETITKEVDLLDFERLFAEKDERHEFGFGYVLTVHKSQGSQWDNVALVNEADCFREDKWRWLYTGVTRAAENLVMYV